MATMRSAEEDVMERGEGKRWCLYSDDEGRKEKTEGIWKGGDEREMMWSRESDGKEHEKGRKRWCLC